MRVAIPGSRHALAPKHPCLLPFCIVTRIVGEGVSMFRIETAVLVGIYALLAPLIIALALR